MKEFIFSKNGTYYKINDFRANRLTLVFVHGLTGSSSAWIKYEKRFKNRYNILTFDLRGHGKSTKFSKEQDYEIEKFIQDIYDLIKFLKIKKFVLISHSFGTIIALGFLHKYPKIVISAIFLNPIYDLKKIKLFEYFQFVIKLFMPLINLFPFYPQNGRHINYSKYINTGDWDIKRLAADISNTTARIYLYCLIQLYKYNYSIFWSKLAMHVLIVHGKKDTISRVENAVTISHIIKNSKLIILGNANHITVINNYNEVSEAIEKFVE